MASRNLDRHQKAAVDAWKKIQSLITPGHITAGPVQQKRVASAARLLSDFGEKGGRIHVGSHRLALPRTDAALASTMARAGLTAPRLLKLLTAKLKEAVAEIAYREDINSNPLVLGTFATIPILKVHVELEWVDLDYEAPKTSSRDGDRKTAAPLWWQAVEAWTGSFSGKTVLAYADTRGELTIEGDLSLQRPDPLGTTWTGRLTGWAETWVTLTAPDIFVRGDYAGPVNVEATLTVSDGLYVWSGFEVVYLPGSITASGPAGTDVENQSMPTAAGFAAMTTNWANAPMPATLGSQGGSGDMRLYDFATDSVTWSLTPMAGGGGGDKPPNPDYNGGDRVSGHTYHPTFDSANPLFTLHRAMRRKRNGEVKHYHPSMPNWKKYSEMWIENSISAGHVAALRDTLKAVREDVDFKSEYPDDMAWFEQTLVRYAVSAKLGIGQ